jgi:hypothetical protein
MDLRDNQLAYPHIKFIASKLKFINAMICR